MLNIFNKLNLSGREKLTFRLHFIFSILDGIILGTLALNEFILIKSLKGTNFQVGFLIQFTVIILLFSIFFIEFQRRVKDKKKMLRVIAVITRAPLFLLIFFPSDYSEVNSFFQIMFLSVFLIYYVSDPIIFPTINKLLKDSYTNSNFGRLYSFSVTSGKIVILIVTFSVGKLLDADNFSFRYLYPILGFLSILSIFVLTRIKFKKDVIIINQSFNTAVKDSFKRMIKIFKENKPYRDFEIGFMFYGHAWMIVIAVITIFFEKKLNLNYTSIAFYKNAFNIIAILTLPFFGKLISRIDPRKFAIYSFGSMMLFTFFMGLTEFLPYHFRVGDVEIYYTLIVSYIFYGLFASTMALLWNIGSAYFCRNEDVTNYQAIHLTLTGLRGLIAPLLGVVFYEIIGFSGVFMIGILLLSFSIILMVRSMKKHKFLIPAN